MAEFFLGLLSGTSMDAIDVALVDFAVRPLHLVATHSHPIPTAVKQDLLKLCQSGADEINQLGQLDVQMGRLFAAAVNSLLSQQQITSENIIALGSHGQTIRHQPAFNFPFTLQIGDPNVIAEMTGITTVADFRRRDMANGGQGAPLAPALHQYLFQQPKKNRAIVNIGGMTNITCLFADAALPILGYDIGPGNVLLDAWVKQHRGQDYDVEGAFAKQGKTQLALLARLFADPYFKQLPPKSTGREYFNLAWLQNYLANSFLPEDVQKTLTTLTAHLIIDAVNRNFTDSCEILICGGGVHNDTLMSLLQEECGNKHQLCSTAAYGIDPDWVEAIAFAWLARQNILHQPGNLPAVTGASRPAILGGVYWGENLNHNKRGSK